MNDFPTAVAAFDALEKQARERRRTRHDFRAAVAQVQTYAANGDVTALTTILHDPDAERAARFAAANRLARAGDRGQAALLAAIRAEDTLAQYAALRTYLLTQDVLDEPLLLEAWQHKQRRVQRGVRRLLKRLPYPIKDEVRLRCYLPSPYCNAPISSASLSEWLSIRGREVYLIADAISASEYLPAVPLLIRKIHRRYYSEGTMLIDALVRIGPAAVPALLDALPEKARLLHPGLVDALGQIGSPRAIEPLENLRKQVPDPDPLAKDVWVDFSPVRQPLDVVLRRLRRGQQARENTADEISLLIQPEEREVQ